MCDHIIVCHAWIPPIPPSNNREEIVRVAVHQLLEVGSADLDVDLGVQTVDIDTLVLVHVNTRLIEQ